MSSQPQFQIRWRDVTGVARDVVTGMSEEEAARAQRAERPMLVYVYDVDEEGQRYAVEEDRAFQTEKVAVGARFFECLRIDSESAGADRLLADHADRAPCLVFLRPTFEVETVQRGRLNANRVFSAMCATLRKDYENCVATVFKKQREIERDRAALQRDKDKLARIEERLAERASARLAREKEELEREIAAAEEKLAAQEGELYVLEPKEERAETS